MVITCVVGWVWVVTWIYMCIPFSSWVLNVRRKRLTHSHSPWKWQPSSVVKESILYTLPKGKCPLPLLVSRSVCYHITVVLKSFNAKPLQPTSRPYPIRRHRVERAKTYVPYVHTGHPSVTAVTERPESETKRGSAPLRPVDWTPASIWIRRGAWRFHVAVRDCRFRGRHVAVLGGLIFGGVIAARYTGDISTLDRVSFVSC